MDNKPTKQTLNMLEYFGADKFDLRFLMLYIVGAVVVCEAANFVFESGRVTSFGWWFGGVGGVIIGVGLYFWDLRKAQK